MKNCYILYDNSKIIYQLNDPFCFKSLSVQWNIIKKLLMHKETLKTNNSSNPEDNLLDCANENEVFSPIAG